ncbi:hypothetical protein BH09PLA1_BH09PLA1_11920 [soil metagenome]
MIAQVETLFLVASDLPVEARSDYLDQACADDPTLRRQVELLLMHDVSPSTAALRSAAGLTLLTTPAEHLPSRLDRYELDARIGEGSFGVVYSAQQDKPVRRRVAVKVLRPGIHGEQFEQRFRIERQALAGLDHPNIARLLDAGSMPDGRPYFVMELISGLPLSSYCDKHRLGLRQRLELFLDVCGGVQHAHRRAILHRDLKPSNILVFDSDNGPVAKVIDFGIARALDRTAESTAGMPLTEAGCTIGTPEYSSPEQVNGDLNHIDTRSDVYSLGIVLYELLSGRLPFDSAQLRSFSAAQMRRIVCETPPPKPSSVWGENASGLEHAAAARGLSSRDLLSQLSNELEWIPLRAMRKDSGERYQSVAELADDVRKHLAGRPLLAGPERRSYRVRKFVQRNRAAVAACAGFVVLAFAAATFYVYSIHQEQSRTSAALEESQSSAQFLNDMLASVDPAQAQGKQILVLDILEQSARDVGERFKSRPAIEASVQATIGKTYRALGHPAQALPHLQTAVDLFRSMYGQRDARYIQSAKEYARTLNDLGRPEEAMTMLSPMLEMGSGKNRLNAQTRAQLLSVLGTSKQALGQWRDAESVFRDALIVCRSGRSDDEGELVNALNNYGGIVENLGRPQEAEPILAEAMQRCRQSHGLDHPLSLSTANAYAGVLNELARYQEAEPILKDTMDRARRVLGPDHPDTIAYRTSYANVLDPLGRTSEAEPIYLDALQRQQKLLGSEHPRALQYMGSYAATLELLGRSREAEPYTREVYARRVETQGLEHPETFTSASQLAWILYLNNKLPECRELLQKTLPIARRRLGDEHPITLGLINNLAIATTEQPEIAAPLFQELIASRKRTQQPDHPDLAQAINNYGVFLGVNERFEESLAMAQESLRLRRSRMGDDHPWTLFAMNNVGLQLHNLQRDDEAEPLSRAAWEGRRRALGDDHHSTMNSLGNYALVVQSLGRLEEAERLQRKALEDRRRVTGPTSTHTLNSAWCLGSLLMKTNRPSEAEPLIRLVYEEESKTRRPDDPGLRRTAERLATVFDALGRESDAIALRTRHGIAASEPMK